MSSISSVMVIAIAVSVKPVTRSTSLFSTRAPLNSAPPRLPLTMALDSANVRRGKHHA
jgi:hypothetical protein